MKYFYGTLASLAVLYGLIRAYPNGFSLESLLWLVFGAVCAVAAEIAEFTEHLKSKDKKCIDD